MIRLPHHNGRTALLAAVLASSLSGSQAMAQDGDLKPSTLFKRVDGNTNIFDYDFGPPSSPALNLLGSDSAGLTPATSLKAFVVAAGNTLQGGASAAIEISPAALFGKINNFDSYQASGLYRLVRRSKIGFAVINGRTGADAVRSGVSAGLSMSLLDGSDPLRTRGGDESVGKQSLMMSCLRTAYDGIVTADKGLAGITSEAGDTLADDAAKFQNLTKAQNNLFRAITAGNITKKTEGTYADEYHALQNADGGAISGLAAPGGTITMPDLQKLADAVKATRDTYRQRYASEFALRVQGFQADFDKCALIASKLASFSTDLDIGVGTFWRGNPGELAGLRNGGGALWAALQLPLPGSLKVDDANTIKSVWMIGASGKYGWRETITTGDAVTKEIRADTLNAWAGIERRSEDLLLSARYGYQQFRANDAIGRFFNRDGERFLLNAQLRLGKTSPMWLGLSYGNANGSADTFNAKRLQINLAFSPPSPDNITGIKD